MNKLHSKLKIIFPLILSIFFTASLAHADFQKGLTAYKNKDYAIAIAEWEPLAQKGYAGAAYKLGKIYQLGQGVPQDYGKAMKWFKHAGKKGVYGAKKKFWRGAAYYTLGLMHIKGEGVAKNQKKAVSLFKKSSRVGAGTWRGLAQYKLGLMTLKGEGGLKPYQKDAEFWFKKSIKTGNKDAQQALDASIKANKKARNKGSEERKRKQKQLASSCSWSKREVFNYGNNTCYVPNECQRGKKNTLSCLEMRCLPKMTTQCRMQAREIVKGCKVVAHSKVGDSKCMEGTPRVYITRGTGACAGPIPGPDCMKTRKLSGKPIPLKASNYKKVLNNNVLETYNSFIYFINNGDVFRARKNKFNKLNAPENYGKFSKRGKIFWATKKRTMGRKSFEGVCIQWQKRKKEKKGRQECYAMQMTPKEVLMDQWHGTQRYSSISYKKSYIVAKRRNIKYLRRKGRFAIN